MKTAIIITLLLLSSSVFAGTREKAKQMKMHSATPAHKVIIDLDELGRQTKDISLLQPLIVVAKWISRPVQIQGIRKEKSFFI